MSGSASIELERQLLQHTLAIAPMPTLARVYVALCQTAPTEAAGGAELAGAGYARTAATFALMATPANAASNATAVDFAPATGDWRPISHFELWTQPTGGTRLYWGQLVDPTDGTPIEIDVLSGSAVRFSPGSLIVQAADSSAGSIGDSLVWAPGGSTPRTLSERTTDNGYSVLETGAKGDWSWDTMTGTNDQTAIQALLDDLPVGHTITFPPGRQFYVGTGLVVSSNSHLTLRGTDFSGGLGNPTTSGLVADANCDVLTVTGPGLFTLENMALSTNATVQPIAGACLRCNGGSLINVQSVSLFNCYDAIFLQGTSSGGGLNATLRNIYTAKIAHVHLVQDTWAEVYISGGGRWGNGPSWGTPLAFISLQGGSTTNASAGPNSLDIEGVQFEDSSGPTHFVQFVNRTPGALYNDIAGIGIRGGVWEGNPSSIFYSDGTWSYINRFNISGIYLNGTASAKVFDFAPSTTIIQGSIGGNKYIHGSDLTLAPTNAMTLSLYGQAIQANVSLTGATGSVVSMSDLEVLGNVTLAGAYRSLSMLGGGITGTLTNTATGGLCIDVPGFPRRHTDVVTMSGFLNITAGATAGTATGGPVSLYLQSVAGNERSLQFYTGTTQRWRLLTTGLAEGGSNAGSNLEIQRFTDAGSFVDVPFSINRATGQVLLPLLAVGASMATGVTIRSGTGAATGTQPKGSQWIRTDGAVGSTLYVSQGGGTWNAVAGV